MCKSNLKNAAELKKKLLRKNFLVHTMVLPDLCIKDTRFIQNSHNNISLYIKCACNLLNNCMFRQGVVNRKDKPLMPNSNIQS